MLNITMSGRGLYVQGLSMSSHILLSSQPTHGCNALINRTISTYNQRLSQFNTNNKYSKKWVNFCTGENSFSAIPEAWKQLRKPICHSSGRRSLTDEPSGTLDSTIRTKVFRFFVLFVSKLFGPLVQS